MRRAVAVISAAWCTARVHVLGVLVERLPPRSVEAPAGRYCYMSGDDLRLFAIGMRHLQRLFRASRARRPSDGDGGASSRTDTDGFVLAQGGAVELKFPGKNFFRSIPSNYGPYKHPGAVFADFGAQVGFL